MVGMPQLHQGWETVSTGSGVRLIRYYAEPTYTSLAYTIQINAVRNQVYIQRPNLRYEIAEIPESVTTTEQLRAWALAIWRMG